MVDPILLGPGGGGTHAASRGDYAIPASVPTPHPGGSGVGNQTFKERLMGLLYNPSLYRGMGVAADEIAPTTIGGALGRIGSKSIQEQQQQGVFDRQQQKMTDKDKDVIAARQLEMDRIHAVIKRLGGIAPDGEQGVTTFATGKNKGSYKFTGDLGPDNVKTPDFFDGDPYGAPMPQHEGPFPQAIPAAAGPGPGVAPTGPIGDVEGPIAQGGAPGLPRAVSIGELLNFSSPRAV